VRISYLSRSGTAYTEREIEPYLLRGVGSSWYLESWDRTNGGERTFRVDRIGSAEMAAPFEPREGLTVTDPQRTVGGHGGTASIWFSPAVAERETEDLHDVAKLVDGARVLQRTYDSERWLAVEVLKHRGEAVLIAPDHLREVVARRAAELAAALRSRAPAERR
jgi:predicted DNA-binding transcriptional regulator YafY